VAVSTSLTDQRLAFLAVRPALEKRSRPAWSKVLGLVTGSGRTHVWRDGMPVYGGSVAGDVQSDRMQSYVLAADIVAQRLSEAERIELRKDGALPPWFLPAVEEAYQSVRKRR
jgi:hypothetical protein